MFFPGMAVFASTAAKTKPWPAIILSPQDVNANKKLGMQFVYWAGDNRHSQVKEEFIIDFMSNWNRIFRKYSNTTDGCQNWWKGVRMIIKHYGAPDTNDLNPEELILYANTYFSPEIQSDVKEYPYSVVTALEIWKQESNEHTVKVKKTSELYKAVSEHTQLTDICICCYDVANTQDHPVFVARVCDYCANLLKKTFHVIDQWGYKYCMLCGNDKGLKACCNENCKQAFCGPCKKNMPFLMDDRFCIICQPYRKQVGYLMMQSMWEYNIVESMIGHIHLSALKPIPLNSEIIYLTYDLYSVIDDVLKIEEENQSSKDETSVDNTEKIKLGYFINFTEHLEENRNYIITLDIRQLNFTNVLKESGIMNVDYLVGGVMMTPLELQEREKLSIIYTFMEFFRILNTIQQYCNKSIKYSFIMSLNIPQQELELINRCFNQQPAIQYDVEPFYMFWSNF